MNKAEVVSLIVCLAGGIQGAVLMYALHKLFNDKNVEHKWLILFIGAVSITLLGRALYLFPYQIDSRIPVLSDLILFVYGPFYFFFLQSVFKDTSVSPKSQQSILHFVPAILHVLATIPLFLISHDEYIRKIEDGSLLPYFSVIMILALGQNFIYWYQGHQFLKKIKSQFTGLKVSISAPYIAFLQNWFLIVIVGFGMSIVMYQFNFYWAGVCYQLVWILASWVVYGLGYFVMIHPETFGDILVNIRENEQQTDAKEKQRIVDLANRLIFLLEEKRIFLDPEISLLSLAKKLESNNVLLSKTINQYFNVRFYDLINKYRVEEFIRLAKNSDNSHFTYYALALQAGFNSKTSFNKYFKKITGLTPKAYFRELKVA